MPTPCGVPGGPCRTTMPRRGWLKVLPRRHSLHRHLGLVAAVWLSPLARAYRFEANGKEILVEGQEPWGWYDYATCLAAAKTALVARQNEVRNMISAQGLSPQEALDRIRSDNRAALGKVLSESNAPLSVHYIPGVAYVEPLEWHYGCTPTAAAMVLNYWDNYSSYGLLTMNFFKERDTVVHESDCHVASLQYGLKVAMHTFDDGWTLDAFTYSGMLSYANSRGYSFAGGAHWTSDLLDTHWNEMVSDIDGGYPFVFGTSNYEGLGEGYSVAAIGYDDASMDLLVYSTWRSNGSTPHRVYHAPGANEETCGDAPRPGGGDAHNVKLISPDGYQGFGSCGSTGNLLSQTETTIRWDNSGTPGDCVVLSYSTNGGTSFLSIGTVPDNGSFVWNVPDLCSTEGRIVISQYSLSPTMGIYSADGSYGDFTFAPRLSMFATVGGMISGSSWHPPGKIVPIWAVPDSGFIFSGWTGTGNGSYSGMDNPANVTMNGSITRDSRFHSMAASHFQRQYEGEVQGRLVPSGSGGYRHHCVGNFNDWGFSTNNPDTLKDTDHDSVYTKQLSLPPTTAYEYKFWKTPRGGPMGWEEGIANRQLADRGAGYSSPHRLLQWRMSEL